MTPTYMSMANNRNSPCSPGTAACNRAVSDDSSVADPDPNQRFINNDWPRFLVIKSLDNKSIVRHSIFVISKALQGIAGTLKTVTPMMKSDLILVEVDKRQQAINLLDTTHLHDIPVEISAHRTLNSCKGVITCGYLQGMKNEEILEDLRDSGQNVKEVHRITSFKEGKKTPTNTIILTFNQKKIPETMYVGMTRVSVRQYIPNPRRCYHCQKFRHTKNFCKDSVPTCGKCGETGHEYDDCGGNACCVNCKGSHPSSSRDCPIWKKEKAIIELKVKEDISFAEAIKRVEYSSKNAAGSSSYSSVVASNTTSTSKALTSKGCEASCQTDYTWPEFLKTPMLIPACIISNDKSVQSTTDDQMQIDIMNTKKK